MTSPCTVIIVTHNSQPYLKKCIDCLKQQSQKPSQIILIDSGSEDTEYVQNYAKRKGFTVVLNRQNIGFCQGNNLGYSHVLNTSQYILLLNPDCFLSTQFLKESIDYMNKKTNQNVGILTGMLLGYDHKTDQPTGKYDSTGIFRTWFGQWYDRGQGQSYPNNLYQQTERVPAICGAAMLCRHKALHEVLLKEKAIFDPTFYMYKEDIDLSLRLRKKGWDLMYIPSFVAYHCRGWNQDRTQVSKKFRLLSARNEIRLYARHKSPYLIYSALKYVAVKLFNR